MRRLVSAPVDRGGRMPLRRQNAGRAVQKVDANTAILRKDIGLQMSRLLDRFLARVLGKRRAVFDDVDRFRKLGERSQRNARRRNDFRRFNSLVRVAGPEN